MVVARAGRLLPGPLADWIRGELRHTSRRQLARRLGVDRRQVHRWLTGTALPTLPPVDRALTRAGVHPSELYGELAPLPEHDRRATCPGCGLPMLEPAPLCGFCIEEEQEANP